MTLAQQTKDVVTANCPMSFSLIGGYGKKGAVTFPLGVQLHEEKDVRGCVIHATYLYADGSKLAYRFDGEAYSLAVK